MKKKKVVDFDLHPLTKELFFAKMKAAEKQTEYLAAKTKVQDVELKISIEKITLGVQNFFNESMKVQTVLQILRKRFDN